MRKIGRLIVISIVFFFVMATILGLLFPSTVVVSRAVDITAPKDSVYPYIKDISGWEKWMDGLNDKTVIKESALNAQLGNSYVSIKGSSNLDSIINATWKTKNNGTQTTSIQLYQQKNQTTTLVHWQFIQHIKWYPWERFASMMNDKIMGSMMEKNLNNLKVLVETH